MNKNTKKHAISLSLATVGVLALVGVSSANATPNPGGSSSRVEGDHCCQCKTGAKHSFGGWSVKAEVACLGFCGRHGDPSHSLKGGRCDRDVD